MRTQLDIAQTYVDQQVRAFNAGQLTAVDAAKSKLYCSELQVQVAELGVQLHGGHGYMDEYPISRLWRDGRVQSIYGGTTEIMKEIIGRNLGL